MHTPVLRLLLLALFLGGVARPLAAAGPFYVSPSGNDTTGTGSISSPWATVGKARDHIRANNLNDNLAADLVVYLRGGAYSVTAPITFATADSGSNGFSVVYRNYPGDTTPIVSGGKNVTGWSQVAGKPYWVASVGTGFPDYFRALWVNGVRARRAQSNRFIAPSRSTWWNDSATPQTRDGVFVLSSSIPTSFTNIGDVRLVWHNSFKFGEFALAGVVNIDADEKALKMAQPSFDTYADDWWMSPPYEFQIVNSFEHLDEPGEWYLNRVTNQLFYFPYSWETMATATVTVPVAEGLLALQGTSTSARLHHLRFEGVIFESGNWTYPNTAFIGGSQAEYLPSYDLTVPGQVVLNFTSDIVIERCVVRQCATGGIQVLDGNTDILIQGGRFRDLTAAAVIVGRGAHFSSAANANSNITIKNNVVRNTGSDYWQATGIDAHGVNGLFIYNNDVSDTMYAGIHQRSNPPGDVPVAHIRNLQYYYNRVSNVLNGSSFAMDDGGAIYSHGPVPASRVHRNYVFGLLDRNTSSPLYTDNFSNDILWDFNVTDARPAQYGIQSWHAGNINVRWDNLYTNNNATILGGDVTITNKRFESAAPPWSAAAQAIIAQTGLESAYADLLDGQMTGVNLARGRPATASSQWDATMSPGKAVDGDHDSIWHTQSGGDANGYWQVDLGTPYVLKKLQIQARWGSPNDTHRSSFTIRASNDPTFATFTVLAEQNALPYPYKSSLSDKGNRAYNRFTRYVNNATAFRYLRVFAGHSFSMSEFNAYGNLP